jgi:hypothetical protein
MALKLLSPALSSKGRGSDGLASIVGLSRAPALSHHLLYTACLSNNTSVRASYWQKSVLICSTLILIFKFAGDERIGLASTNFSFIRFLTYEIRFLFV